MVRSNLPIGDMIQRLRLKWLKYKKYVIYRNLWNRDSALHGVERCLFPEANRPFEFGANDFDL